LERRGVERPRAIEGERRPGTNVELAQYYALGDDGALDAALSDLSSLGVYWLRQRFPWAAIEPAPGVYNWARWDGLVEAVDRHGLGLIAVLEAPPSWAQVRNRYPLPCSPPCRADAYARFVAAFAQRYGRIIDHYQVWDEPNLSRSWGGGHAHPCGYLALLEAAYPAIHAADANAWVLGGGLAPTQAPGPADVNDLDYLRHLYALGGVDSMDVLAVKGYGFWSGPEDRRVAPDVLNYSRLVGLRELQRSYAGQDGQVWAVEWGWAVLPGDWTGEPAPWGSDRPTMQGPRILGAVARARAEWPWMDVMCWAAYQPDVPGDDPRWGFALRDRAGRATALYPVLREMWAGGGGRAGPPASIAAPWGAVALVVVALPIAYALWRRCGCGLGARRAWRAWSGLPWPTHLAAALALAALYAVTQRPEWIAVELIGAALVLYNHPRWATIGAVFCIPFVYLAKRIELGTRVLDVPPAEVLLWLAVAIAALRRLRALHLQSGRVTHSRRALRMWGRWRALDVLWVAWVALGVTSPLVAPDPALAWREWRLAMLGPMALYFLLRGKPSITGTPWCQGHGGSSRAATDVVVAWLASGALVALVGVGQWTGGAIVEAGGVGRVTGVYYSPNHLALYLERLLPLALALALYGGLSGRLRLAAWSAVAILGLAVYLTYSRAAWTLAMPVALLVIGASYRRRLRSWAVAVAVATLLLAASGVLQGRSLSPSALHSAPHLVGVLDEVRIPVWQSTLEMIADHPWMGVGLDGFRFVYPRYMRIEAWTEPLLYHPHNAWLDAAVRLGLPGLAAYGLLVGSVVRGVRRRGKWAAETPYRGRGTGRDVALLRAVAVGCLAGVWAGLAHGMVDSGYFVIDLAWCLALVGGVLAGVSHSQYDADRAALKPPR
jgi:O-antigen ligase